MWSGYLEDVKDYDKKVADNWTEDANGIFIFVSPTLMVPVSVPVTNRKAGLLSATVGSFIIESYKRMSPDSGDQTVFLLGQMSQQIAGIANGSYIQAQSPLTFSPSVSAISVNALWLLSLVFSTTSAMLATLTRQWARRYTQLLETPNIPRDRARVRSFLFLGTKRYNINLTVEVALTLLHCSVFLFYAGLVIFFFTIFKTMAIVVLIPVGLFATTYFTFTILPFFDRSCPYFTPMSSMSWYLWHTSAYFARLVLRQILRQLHTLLVPYNLGDISSWRQRTLTRSLEYVEISVKRHKRRLMDGFRRSIFNDALSAPRDTDVNAFTWLFQLPALVDKRKVEKFVAGMPGETIAQLFSNPAEHGKISFRDHLFSLLRSCAPGTIGLDEGTQSHRLSVCLDAVHHIAKAPFVPNGVSLSSSLLKDVRIHFANIGLMRSLWADKRPEIHVTARSICALLARHLLRKGWLESPELAWLQDVMEQPSNTLYSQLDNPPAVDYMNIDSFIFGVLADQKDDLPITQATTFTKTLAILMNSGSQIDLRRDTFAAQLPSLIQRMEEADHKDRDIGGKLRRMYQGFLPSAE
jgi:hypothetical protein